MTETCKGVVWRASGQVAGWGRHSPCYKKATKDGYCGTHHPDAVAKREARLEEDRKRRADEDRAKWARVNRERALLAAIGLLTPAQIATLPESLRNILTPEEPTK